ncbi:hypothetical protein PG996_011447 [Apiospora saccharicola]|uniref:Tat pathway signal sequence protein n=1 Tax=Apiospora saccharicola TaxID=335842 RepID=A0ABR1UF46_9PEZI
MKASPVTGWFKRASYVPLKDEAAESYHDSDSTCSSSEGLIGGVHGKSPNSRKHIFPLVHTCIIAIYTAVYLILLRRGVIAARSYQHKVWSPAYEAVEKIPQEYQGQLRIVSPYQGPPSPEVDQAWKELLQYSNIRVSGEDLRKVNKTSIPMPGEEDSYWVELSVVHELHCIKRLRQYWFKDYYFPNITDEERRLNWLHNDHCLEILRQSVMCHADVSMITMTWEPTSVFPAADFQNVHECTNWDKLYEWQKERSRDLMAPGVLVHPYLASII